MRPHSRHTRGPAVSTTLALWATEAAVAPARRTAHMRPAQRATATATHRYTNQSHVTEAFRQRPRAPHALTTRQNVHR